MKKILLPLIALAAGFANAFLAAGIHSLFFVLLPLLAFVFGYSSTWRCGLLYGFLLFIGYTFATALMWEVANAFLGISQYIVAFIAGGFTILLLGALAPNLRKSIKKPVAIASLIILVGVIVWCGYISIPRYWYNAMLNILCQEDMEVYVPVAVASDKLSAELLGRTTMPTGTNPPDWYAIELVNTEHGEMWRLNMYGRLSSGLGQEKVGRSSNWYHRSEEIVSWPGHSPEKMIQFSPKYNVLETDKVGASMLSCPPAITGARILETFDLPIKVKTEKEADFQMTLRMSVERVSNINFGYTKSEGYTESIEWIKSSTGDNWIMAPTEARKIISIRGSGD